MQKILRKAVGELAIMLFASRCTRKVYNQRLTYLDSYRLLSLSSQVNDVLRRGVEGDFLEFGVALGGSAIMISDQIQSSGRRFIAIRCF